MVSGVSSAERFDAVEGERVLAVRRRQEQVAGDPEREPIARAAREVVHGAAVRRRVAAQLRADAQPQHAVRLDAQVADEAAGQRLEVGHRVHDADGPERKRVGRGLVGGRVRDLVVAEVAVQAREADRDVQPGEARRRAGRALFGRRFLGLGSSSWTCRCPRRSRRTRSRRRASTCRSRPRRRRRRRLRRCLPCPRQPRARRTSGCFLAPDGTLPRATSPPSLRQKAACTSAPSLRGLAPAKFASPSVDPSLPS